MADGIYVGMAGADARAAQLDSIAENLANGQTPGYKATRPAFQSFLPEGEERSVHVFPAAVATGIDLRPGPTLTTGNPLDVLPNDGAFLTVMLPDGTNGFTRNGRLVLVDGVLMAAGRPVVDVNNQAIEVPLDAKVEVAKDGSVTVDQQQITTLALAQLQGPMERHGNAILRPQAGGVAVESQTTLAVGVIENGNAPPMEAAVQMITAQRQYEASMQALSTYRRLDERANEIGRVR